MTDDEDPFHADMIAAVEALVPPHCDAAVLHAPRECTFCDELPIWQALRAMWGIAFSGHPPKIHRYGSYVFEEIACPSDIRRPGGLANGWPGNWADSGE